MAVEMQLAQRIWWHAFILKVKQLYWKESFWFSPFNWELVWRLSSGQNVYDTLTYLTFSQKLPEFRLNNLNYLTSYWITFWLSRQNKVCF